MPSPHLGVPHRQPGAASVFAGPCAWTCSSDLRPWLQCPEDMLRPLRACPQRPWLGALLVSWGGVGDGCCPLRRDLHGRGF